MHQTLFARFVCFCVALLCAGWGPCALAAWQLEAPAELETLLYAHLELDVGDAVETGVREAKARALEREARDLLATEGYFSPLISFELALDTPPQMRVQAGERTSISSVQISFEGALESDQAEALRTGWALPVGEAFRQSAWSEAKQALLASLLRRDYPDAALISSRAEIDPASHSAQLVLHYSTGPKVVFGALHYEGLSRYTETLAQRYNRSVRPGAAYREADLLALQAALQQTPYFSSVYVELMPAEQATAGEAEPVQVRPVRVRVSELRAHQLSTGLGFSSNTGARAELGVGTADFLHRGWDLQTGVRIAQRRQTGFADLYFPPMGDGAVFGVGGAVERSDIENLYTEKRSIGVLRKRQRARSEIRDSFNWETETVSSPDQQARYSRVFTLNRLWSWRRIDSFTEPRAGNLLMLEAGGGIRSQHPEQPFTRLHGNIQHFLPVGKQDVFSLRLELGATFAETSEGIPNDWLFRTGGSQTVRGYAYQSLGVKQGNTVYGGRYLAAASMEYTHWISGPWGAAVFVDAGDAANAPSELKLARAAGTGLRWRSPVGPLGLDFAWAERDHRWRAHLSLAVAF